MKKLKSVQSARGFAALIVVFYHSAFQCHKKFGFYFLDNFFQFGYAGVDIFFVLSGFILYYIHHADLGYPERLKSYITKRAVRIYPIYWITLFSILPIFFMFPTFGQGHERDIDVILKSIFLFPQEKFPILTVSWSLSYEILFYSVFGIGILLSRFFFYLISAVIGLISLGSLISQIYRTAWLPFPISFLFSPFNLEFILGCLAASIVLSEKLKFKHGLWFSILGSLSFLIFACNDQYLTEKFEPHRIWTYGIASFFMILGITLIESKKDWKPHPFSQFLGDASYSIYLWHFPLLSLGSKVFLALHVYENIGATSTFALMLSSSLLLCCIAYQFIEKPLLHILQNKILSLRTLSQKNQFFDKVPTSLS